MLQGLVGFQVNFFTYERSVAKYKTKIHLKDIFHLFFSYTVSVIFKVVSHHFFFCFINEHIQNSCKTTPWQICLKVLGKNSIWHSFSKKMPKSYYTNSFVYISFLFSFPFLTFVLPSIQSQVTYGVKSQSFFELHVHSRTHLLRPLSLSSTCSISYFNYV